MQSLHWDGCSQPAAGGWARGQTLHWSASSPPAHGLGIAVRLRWGVAQAAPGTEPVRQKHSVNVTWRYGCLCKSSHSRSRGAPVFMSGES